MEPINELQSSLIRMYAKDAVYYSRYTGSWITEAVYQFDYASLGKLLSQMLPITEGENFVLAGGFDGHNAFEEFVCGLLLELFQTRQVIMEDKGLTRINISTLEAVLSECQAA